MRQVQFPDIKAAKTNPRALILYQAMICRLWHSTLKGEGTCLNLPLIQESLLMKLEIQIQSQDLQEMQREVSNLPFCSFITYLLLTTFPPTPPSNPLYSRLASLLASASCLTSLSAPLLQTHAAPLLDYALPFLFGLCLMHLR